MDWEQWFCPNHYCTVEVWLVQQCATARELWLVVDGFGSTPYTIAAVDPVCPRCGTTLCRTVVELEGRLDRHFGAEVEPGFDFARSLPERTR